MEAARAVLGRAAWRSSAARRWCAAWGRAKGSGAACSAARVARCIGSLRSSPGASSAAAKSTANTGSCGGVAACGGVTGSGGGVGQCESDTAASTADGSSAQRLSGEGDRGAGAKAAGDAGPGPGALMHADAQ